MKQITLLLLVFTTVTFAQRNERIKSLKRAHITDALSLTSNEAEKFWPIYNIHEDSMHSLKKKERKAIRDLEVNSIDQLTDSQANTIIENRLQQKEKELVYIRELYEKLKTVIPAQKIVRLHRAEEEFKRMLLKRMRDHKGSKKRN